MKLAFVQNFNYEYLGVMSISATVKQAGHQTQVFINSWEKDLTKSIAEFNPDLIAFPVYSGSQDWVLKTTQILKKKLHKLIVLGGPHATFNPEIIQSPGIDIICRGEGEFPMLELLNCLAQDKSYTYIPNLWIKHNKTIIKNRIRPLIDPLNSLPLLDREIYRSYSSLTFNPVKDFNIGRGCPFACSYCHNSGLIKIHHGLGRLFRLYQPNRVIKEIIQVQQKYPIKTIHFVDDIFITDKKWLHKFLPLYKAKVGLPYVCNIRGGMLDDTLAKNLAESGCISVFLGIETGNENMRIKLLKKVVTNKSLEDTAGLLHKYKIKLAANNMVGLPGETVEQAFETIKLNAKIKVDLPWCAIFQPYPGTEITNYCLQEGLVTKADLNKIGGSFHRQSILKNKQTDELVRLHKLFHLGVWFPAFIPIIKILIKLPLNPLYDLIFLVNQGLTYKKFSKLKWVDFIPHAKVFTKLYFSE